MEQRSTLPGLDFRGLIAERTRDFIGRDWIFAEIDVWLADPTGSRYFFIAGSPGSGKTALMAKLIQTRTVAASYFCIANNEKAF
ncbi:MAG: P-loop domain-containing protein [Ktedonobacteraceae bacterium]